MKLSRLTLIGFSFAIINSASAFEVKPFLINGAAIPSGSYKEVVNIEIGNASCTATIVGPKTIITAAHCAARPTATFDLGGKKYTVKLTKSSLYPGEDHDIAIGLSDIEFPNVTPAMVVGDVDQAKVNIELTLLGYGCTQPGGGGGNDGVLRYGKTIITGFEDYDMVSQKNGGAALCFGDSGGPAFIAKNNRNYLLGVNSKGNIRDKNWNTRTDRQESIDFLKAFASSNNAVICGINSPCNNVTPTAPTCTIAPEPSLIQLGSSITLRLKTAGEVTSAQINGQSVSFPEGTLMIQPQSVGSFTANGSATGDGGTGSCSTTYRVEDKPIIDPPPTCTLTASPSWVNLNQTVILTLKTTGNVNKAYIGNQSVTFPSGSVNAPTGTAGTFTVQARAEGTGGTGNCSASYQVGGDISPNTPDFALVPTYCGTNALPETTPSQVCLSVMKVSEAMSMSTIANAIQITNKNGSKEGLLSLKKKPFGSNSEDWTLFANAATQVGRHTVLETRLVTVTFSANGTPTSVKGRSAAGQYFVVESLTPAP